MLKWVVRYLIWQTFACINQQIQSFTLLLKATKICWRRFVKIWLVVPPLSSRARLWLTNSFFPQINEFVQVNCRHRRKPTLSLFDVSTNTYWIVYEMEL